MVSESNFIVRHSGRKENSFYIDYMGVYKITDISRVVGIEASTIKEIFHSNNAQYEEGLDVYYFDTLSSAQKAIKDILTNTKSEQKGRIICLTDAEIEYLRKALINEGSNVLHLKNKIKDGIFKKLNA